MAGPAAYCASGPARLPRRRSRTAWAIDPRHRIIRPVSGDVTLPELTSWAATLASGGRS